MAGLLSWGYGYSLLRLNHPLGVWAHEPLRFTVCSPRWCVHLIDTIAFEPTLLGHIRFVDAHCLNQKVGPFPVDSLFVFWKSISDFLVPLPSSQRRGSRYRSVIPDSTVFVIIMHPQWRRQYGWHLTMWRGQREVFAGCAFWQFRT